MKLAVVTALPANSNSEFIFNAWSRTNLLLSDLGKRIKIDKVLLTDLNVVPSKWDHNHIIRCNLKNLDDYNRASLFKYCKIDADYTLTIQEDGFLINPIIFEEVLFEIADNEVDYIGAPWQKIPAIVGNSGFCLRSNKINKKLGKMKYYGTINSTFLFEQEQEQEDKKTNIDERIRDDIIICVKYRSFLESKKIKFANFELAEKFSFEYKYVPNTAGFHGRMTTQSRLLIKNSGRAGFYA